MKKTSVNIVVYVGSMIRSLRESYPPKGLSQLALSKKLKVSANTISRWETGTYKPSIEDLDRISRFFGVSLSSLFPDENPKGNAEIAALLRTASSLAADDLIELQRYAEFRKARKAFDGARPASTNKKKKDGTK